MIQAIQVGPGWTRYAGSEDGAPIEPGEYYAVSVKKPKSKDPATIRGWEKFRNSLCLVPAKPPTGGFCWLAPAEPWVKRVLVGVLDAPAERSGNVDWNMLHIDPATLRDWQREFVEQAWFRLERGQKFHRVGHVSLGGGKTLAGLMLLALGERGIVLAPRHVHETWRTEAQKWGYDQPTISTYESAHKLVESKPDVVVCDELHLAKCSSTARHDNAARLCERAQVAVGFTASLMGGGGPFDLRSLRVIVPGSVPASETAWRFLFGLDTDLKEVAPGRKAYVTTSWDTDKISTFVKPYVETVDTSHLLSQLPELSERVVTLPRPNEYESIRMGVATTRNKSKLTAQLRQCTDGFVVLDDGAVVPMMTNAKLQYLAEFVEHLGEPVVIYAAWTESIARIARELKRYQPSVLEGATGDADYQIERFKTGQTQVLIANSKFSAGMNLQHVCRTMVFYSLSTSPVDLIQARGRIYRPGQTRGCQIVYLQCADTIDQRAYELVKNHEELSEEQVEKLLAESM